MCREEDRRGNLVNRNPAENNDCPLYVCVCVRVCANTHPCHCADHLCATLRKAEKEDMIERSDRGDKDAREEASSTPSYHFSFLRFIRKRAAAVPRWAGGWREYEGLLLEGCGY